VTMLSSAVGLDGSSDPRLRRMLQVARDRRPNDPELLIQFAENERWAFATTRELRAFAEALAGYRACIALRPDDAAAYYGIGTLLSDQGDDAGAVPALRAAIARNPKLNFARINLADSLNKLGDLDGAIAVGRETVQLDPSFVMAYIRLGYDLQKKGDFDGV